PPRRGPRRRRGAARETGPSEASGPDRAPIGRGQVRALAQRAPPPPRGQLRRLKVRALARAPPLAGWAGDARLRDRRGGDGRCRDRAAGRAGIAPCPHDTRLLRRLPGGVTALERRGDRRGVPVGGIVPRRGRTHPRLRVRRVVVPGLLYGRLPDL